MRHGSVAVPDDEEAPAATTRSSAVAAWPIRRKLVALVALPLVVIIAICAVLVIQGAGSLQDSRKVRSLADLVLLSDRASGALGREQAQSVTTATSGAAAQVLQQLRPATDQAMSRLAQAIADPPPGGWPGRVADEVGRVGDAGNRLSGVRSGVDAGGRAPDQMIAGFQSLQDVVLALSDAATTQISSLTDRAAIADSAFTAAAIVRASAAAGQERDILLVGLNERRLSSRSYQALLRQAAAQEEQFTSAAQRATPDQARRLDDIRTDDDRMNLFREDAGLLTTVGDVKVTNSNLNEINATLGNPAEFASLADQRVAALSDLGIAVADSTARDAAGAARRALVSAAGFLALAVLVVLAVLVILTMIARTITGPLRRLRSNAVELSHVVLPATMTKIDEQGGEGDAELPSVLPEGYTAGPETIEVARAVDDIGAEAVRLAAAQVRLRRSLDEAFVSMSRRSQSMVEKQLAIIDELESAEQDPDHLRNLFRLDHLAARMRRYNDNLLVIAGSAVRTRTTSPVRIAELFRAATSEMEQYERVRLQPVGSAAVLGTVAGELIHLLAELLDNAAMYSPPTSPITLSAAFTGDGGLHLEVIDSGVGIPANELARLNARLAAVSDDAEVSSRMGLFVVARLARRGGFAARLQARADSPGTVAQISVPAGLVIGAPGTTGEPLQHPDLSLPAPAPAVPAPAPANGIPDPEAPRRSAAGLPVRTPGAAGALPRRPLSPLHEPAQAPGQASSPVVQAQALGQEPAPDQTTDTDGLFTPAGAGRPAAEPAPSSTESAARSAAAASYTPVHDDLPMIGSYSADTAASTPIFDSISAWFADDPETREIPLREVAVAAAGAEHGQDTTIDLRDAQTAAVTSSRWESLDDRHWVATTARAAAGPEVSGSTETGLPRRRPGANLLPSASAAATAAPAPAAGRSSGGGRDADAVRGRLGSYQRGLASARASGGPRPNPFDGGPPSSGGLFTAVREPGPGRAGDPPPDEPTGDDAGSGVPTGTERGTGPGTEPGVGGTGEVEIVDLRDQRPDGGRQDEAANEPGTTPQDDQGADT